MSSAAAQKYHIPTRSANPSTTPARLINRADPDCPQVVDRLWRFHRPHKVRAYDASAVLKGLVWSTVYKTQLWIERVGAPTGAAESESRRERSERSERSGCVLRRWTGRTRQ